MRITNLQPKFEGDLTVNEFEIMVLPKYGLSQSQNHKIPTQVNQTPHNLTSIPKQLHKDNSHNTSTNPN